jgi:hypothetical protein
MTDEGAVSISSGGAIAVDTESLRNAAAALDVVTRRVAAAADHLGRAGNAMGLIGTVETIGVNPRARMHGVEELARGGAASRDDLLAAAASYEIVELRVAEHLALASGDEAEARRLGAEIDAVAREHPDALARADEANRTRADGMRTVIDQGIGGALLWGSGPALLLPSLFALSIAAFTTVGFGRIRFGSRPRPGATPATLLPLTPALHPGSPRGLADVAGRIPRGESGIRVETYRLAGGSLAYAVYVGGTKGLTSAPFDMTSNTRGYTGRESSAYATVRAALEDAGVRPGDTVYLAGHSQGGMTVGQIAATGDFDVPFVGTFGAPTAADPGPGALSIDVRHTDDPVAALAAGGHAGQVGAEGSFVAERLVDPAVGPHDLSLPAHHLEEYEHTAEMIDASDDPRVAAVRESLGALEGAELVAVREWGADLLERAQGYGPRAYGG